jgi:hypothetical protein
MMRCIGCFTLSRVGTNLLFDWRGVMTRFRGRRMCLWVYARARWRVWIRYSVGALFLIPGSGWLIEFFFTFSVLKHYLTSLL